MSFCLTMPILYKKPCHYKIRGIYSAGLCFCWYLIENITFKCFKQNLFHYIFCKSKNILLKTYKYDNTNEIYLFRFKSVVEISIGF